MPDESLVNRSYKWHKIGARHTGRPKNRWEDNVRNDPRNMKIQNCLQQTKDRKSWKKIVEKAKAF
ncbi:hypothetical protein C0J52_10801 [Blattella germanica]|nr:hypothetical protein C0J52_10801 [Blattella germanica]